MTDKKTKNDIVLPPKVEYNKNDLVMIKQLIDIGVKTTGITQLNDLIPLLQKTETLIKQAQN